MAAIDPCRIPGAGIVRERLLQQAQPQPSPEAQELLAQLRDIHEPAPISWWPPALGWWLVALLLLACAAATFLWIRRKRKQHLRNRYRVEAVRLLDAVDTGNLQAVQEINEILKRVAVTTYGRTTCGNLTGSQWLDFLQNTATVECPTEAQKVLLEHLYRKDIVDANGNARLRDYAVHWVQQHRETLPAPTAQIAAEAAGV